MKEAHLRIRSAALVVALALSGLAAVSSPAGASAATTLPLTTANDILVDQADGLVFLSGYAKSAGGSGLVTTDLNGNLVAKPAVPDVQHIARTPDGNSLVVTRGDGRISVVDPTTVTVTSTVTMPGDCAVGDLAPSSGKVFFLYYCAGEGYWKLGAVDLGTAVFTLGLQTFSYYDGNLETVPAEPSMLVANVAGQLEVLDTSGGASPTASVRAVRYIGNNSGAVLTPDGSTVVTGDMQVLATDDLAHVGSYYTPSGKGAVAVREDGVVAAWSAGLVSFFEPGHFEPDRTMAYPFDSTGGPLVFGAKRLYVFDTLDGAGRLRLETPGPAAGLKITTGTTTYDYGASPSVAVQLTGPAGSRQVRIYATPAGGSRTLVKTVATDPLTGKATVTVPPVARNTAYRAEFDGDDDFSAAASTTSVNVRPKLAISTPSRSMSSYFHKLSASPVQNLTVTALPARSYCTQIAIERYTSSSGWKGVVTVHCPQYSTSGKYVTGLAGHRKGDRIRIRVYSGTTPANVASTSPWYYILFT